MAAVFAASVAWVAIIHWAPMAIFVCWPVLLLAWAVESAFKPDILEEEPSGCLDAIFYVSRGTVMFAGYGAVLGGAAVFLAKYVFFMLDTPFEETVRIVGTWVAGIAAVGFAFPFCAAVFHYALAKLQ